jgi:hypothetical protein
MNHNFSLLIGENIMTDKIIKPKIKRLAKGKRLHIRRLKQEARKEGAVYRPVI